MKVILITLAVFCISAQGFELPQNVTAKTNAIVAKLISQGFIHRLQKEMTQRKESKAALLPPIDDPAYLPTLEIPLDFDLLDFLHSKGHTSYCQPEVTGLSVLTDEFVLNPIGVISVNWNLEIPNVAIKGPYQLDQVASGLLFMNETADHIIKGEGEFAASVKNVFFKLEATGRALVGPITLLTLSVDLGYSDLTATAEASSIDDVEIDLGQLSSIIDTLFAAVWTEANKPVINEAIRCTINHVVGGCTLADITGGNLECLDLTLDPTCFEGAPKENETKFLIGDDFSTKALGYCDQFTTEPPSTTPGEATTPVVGSSSSTVATGSTGSTSEATTKKDDGENAASNLFGQNSLFLISIAALSLIFNTRM